MGALFQLTDCVAKLHQASTAGNVKSHKYCALVAETQLRLRKVEIKGHEEAERSGFFSYKQGI